MFMYNDFQLADHSSALAMRQKFDHIESLELQDLYDIKDKLTDQKKLLSTMNNTLKYQQIIKQLDSDIQSIKDIINRNNHLQLSCAHNFNKYHNQPVFSNNISSDNHEHAYSKIRSENEMMSHNQTLNPTLKPPSFTPPNINNSNNNTAPNNNQINQPGINNPGVNNLTPPNKSNTISNTSRKRNSPLQGNILSSLIQSIFLKKKEKPIDTKYQNRFHNIITQGENCNIEKQLLHNQVDILRLLLLFISLKPNCKYLPKIAKITNSQFEVLLQLLP